MWLQVDAWDCVFGHHNFSCSLVQQCGWSVEVHGVRWGRYGCGFALVISFCGNWRGALSVEHWLVKVCRHDLELARVIWYALCTYPACSNC